MAPPRVTNDDAVIAAVKTLGIEARISKVAAELGIHKTTSRTYLDRLVEGGQLTKTLVRGSFVYSVSE